MAIIKTNDEGLNALRSALETAGESYKSNLARLQNLINEITGGDIQGDLATDLLNKFRAKEATFRNLATTIDEAEEYMGMKKQKFGTMIGDVKGGMH